MCLYFRERSPHWLLLFHWHSGPEWSGNLWYFIPVTLIITLFASLIVAYIINPVFAIDFMKHEDEDRPTPRKEVFKKTAWIILAALPFYLLQRFGIANLIVFIALSYLVHNLWGYKVFRRFQTKTIPAMMRRYENLLIWALKGKTAGPIALGNHRPVCFHNDSLEYCRTQSCFLSLTMNQIRSILI